MNTLVFLEHWGAVGHLTHPTSKNKMGFSHEEILEYSPDLQSHYNIHFIALHKSCSHHENLTEEKTINSVFVAKFPDIYEGGKFELKRRKLNPEHYWLLPAHPWQFKNRLPEKFDYLIIEKLILLNSIFLPVTPVLSFRTVIPTSIPLKPHIKLPIDIRLTSVIRTLTPETTRIGPRLAKLLECIFAKENLFSKKLYHCKDIIGVHVQTSHDY